MSMPLALLLKSSLGALRAAGGALTPWLDIVAFESTIVERARGAFLVHWFGSRLPFQGLSLRAHITNLAELDARFLAVQGSVAQSPGGPNLTEPLLGFAGTLASLLLSPVGAIIGAALLLKAGGFGLGVLWKALVLVAIPGLLIFGLAVAPGGTAILFGGGLAAAGVGFSLMSALGDRRDVRSVFDLFGALARLMNATVSLLGQFTGARSAVRNPLLRRVLDLADRLAALLAQGLGAVSTMVTRLTPILEPMALTLVRLGDLAGGTTAALRIVLGGLGERVDELRSGRLSIAAVLVGAMAVAGRQVRQIRDALLAQFDVLVEAFSGAGTALVASLGDWVAKLGAKLLDLFTTNPTGRVITAFKNQLDVVSAVLEAAEVAKKEEEKRNPKPKPPPGPNPLAPLLAVLPKLPPIPPFPDLPTLPDTAKLSRDLGGAAVPALDLAAIERAAAGLTIAPVELSADARAAAARAGRLPSIFAAERRALAERFGPPADALARNRERLAGFRTALSAVVGRVLPPELRVTAAPQLAAVLAAADELVYGLPAPAAGVAGDVVPDRLPVLDLPDNNRLRPVVKTLRLRMPGAPVGVVRRFEALLTERLQRQSYVADGA
ncbi:hypothetical protein [Phytohabitans rumicis]|uniref:Uncharacterized protein n=1 Tax=Phytohabitans rumicis TaxID=1076125 RepID=A0A6V8LDA0_9ACTN|nr:hypothetical protein [Phytohabitans rumicis]GFJ95203.1 hypothetical protein Prum_088450 [Phytohabitans rumicis]